MAETMQDVKDEAVRLADRRGAHYAAATVHNKYSNQFGDIYNRIYSYLVDRCGFRDTWKEGVP